jgi:hypothetical protein
MQIERLQGAGEREEEDRWGYEDADVEMHLAQKLEGIEWGRHKGLR